MYKVIYVGLIDDAIGVGTIKEDCNYEEGANVTIQYQKWNNNGKYFNTPYSRTYMLVNKEDLTYPAHNKYGYIGNFPLIVIQEIARQQALLLGN